MSLRLYLFTLGVVIGLVAGAITVHKRLLPWQVIQQAQTTLKDYIQNYQAYAGKAPVNQLFDDVYDGAGVIQSTEARAPGTTLMAGVKGNAVGLWLLSGDGEELREWIPPFDEIFADTSHIEGETVPVNALFTLIHGAALLPDGGVLFTVANYAVVKMGPCGTVDWVAPTMGHHSVFRDDTGRLWAVSRNYHSTRSAAHPQYRPPFWEDTVVELSPEGEILQEISMLDVIAKNRLHGALFAGQRPTPRLDGDLLHLNDVEVLDAGRAAAFPGLDAGDIMVSLRNPNMVVIFDPETLEARWVQSGPWIRQHDPDFTDDGHIMVFDNRNDGRKGAFFGGSQIVRIRPEGVTGATWEPYYEHSEATPFFTAKRGMLDVLDNGNLLIVESEAGRAFEITPEKEIVWEYINSYDDTRSATLMHAERYPPDYAEGAYASCN